MPFEDNNGSVNYPLSCGIASDIDWDAELNNGSRYYGLSSNDYILWCQETIFPPITSNNGSEYYFHFCGLSSDEGYSSYLHPDGNGYYLQPDGIGYYLFSSEASFTENNGTRFYYSSAFNNVSFCE